MRAAIESTNFALSSSSASEGVSSAILSPIGPTSMSCVHLAMGPRSPKYSSPHPKLGLAHERLAKTALDDYSDSGDEVTAECARELHS